MPLPVSGLGNNIKRRRCMSRRIRWLTPSEEHLMMFYIHQRTGRTHAISTVYSASQKNPLKVFWHFFPNHWEFLVQILHAYYAFLSTLEYKFCMILSGKVWSYHGMTWLHFWSIPRNRDAQHGVGVCCALAPQLVAVVLAHNDEPMISLLSDLHKYLQHDRCIWHVETATIQHGE